jgi:predicted CxxxxCH...CXXCH cytochrome family protein
MRDPSCLGAAAAVLLGTSLFGCAGSTTEPTGPRGPSHAAHLQGGKVGLGFACGDCHGGQGFVVDFSQATMARMLGATPAFSAPTQTCSSTYCHGTFTFGAVRGSAGAPSWSDPGPFACDACHGMPPAGHPAYAGPTTAAGCRTCHELTVRADGAIDLATGAHMNGRADVSGAACTSCHGTAGRTGHLPGTDKDLAAAPPAASAGARPSATGAHQGHVNPTSAGAVAAPLGCAECHAVPTDGAHATAPPAQKVVFGTLASARGAAPAWDAGTAGCSASYCHGNFAFNGVSGAGAAPLWTDTAPLGCTACHGMPPAGHPALAGAVTAATCSACHPQAVRPDGSINLAGGAHLNGRADVSAEGCTGCHGDATRRGILPGTDPQLASAPPLAPAGAPAQAVGAHQRHLNPAAASAIAAPVACGECHAVPSDAAHATQPPAQKVVFGTLASSRGAAPAWNAGTAGCSASYCHGNFTFNGVGGARAAPLWTDAAPMQCTSCHGMPPTGHPALAGAVTAANCSACHPQAVSPDGRINLSGGGHLNGRADVSATGCTGCHGDASRVGILPGTDPQLASAPPAAPSGAPAFAVGAHQGHLNPRAASALANPIACSECHPVQADAAHATAPPAQRVVFGTLASSRGAVPTWDAGTAGCAASYCHGNFTFNGVSGARAAPLWSDTAALQCTSCHGMPPTGHPAVAGTTAASCSSCHPQAVNRDGTINRTGHLNGRADGGGCTTCHGSPPTTGSHGDHRNRRCDACHPTGYSSTTVVSAYHDNGVKDLGPQAGWNAGSRTCANSCHGQERW